MLAAIVLAVLIGVSLGLLGGGGSILTVPLFVYVLGLEPRRAIATSLLVVGITSAAAAAQHARAGRVRWRTALTFGAAGMAGAFGGGRVARLVPADLLLGGFALMMLATAVAMLRGRRAPAAAAAGDAARELPVLRVLALGAGVGSVTGLVGAGGGFVVVPALVLLGGLPMNAAVGTSLVVIAMQSLAGFAGHLGHVPVDAPLAAGVTAAAVVGTALGGALAGRVAPDALRRGFGWFVLAMAVFVLGQQLPAGARAAVHHAVLVARWPWYVGGAALAGFVVLLLWADNKLLGVSTGYAEVCALRDDPAARRSWRPGFLLGIVLGGLVAARLAGLTPALALDGSGALALGGTWARGAALLAAGVALGYGARVAGGCTSGHGIVGVAQGSRASLVATGIFMATGFVVTQALARLHG